MLSSADILDERGLLIIISGALSNIFDRMLNGYVIYLKSDCVDLAARMENDKSRPLLQKGDLKETLDNLFKFRDPLYVDISDQIIETKNKRASDITSEIESLLNKL